MIVNCAAPHTPGGGGRWFKTLWGSGGADKNQHRIEEADERFKEIQNAYDTLSQPQERAWCVRRGTRFDGELFHCAQCPSGQGRLRAGLCVLGDVSVRVHARSCVAPSAVTTRLCW